MDKEYFLEVLRRYLNNTATLKEQEFLIKYYDLFQSDIDLSAYFDQVQKEELKKEIRDAIRVNISKTTRKVFLLKARYISIAAASVLVAICLTGVLFLRKDKPAGKSASLNSVHKRRPNLFVVLPDGSKVVLSYGSKLSYASSFSGLAKREVYLIGEGFFDIKHNNLKPFIVHTGKIQTTVLGTAFDVRALAGDKVITVTVTRGRVKVSNNDKLLGVITPDQQLTFNENESNSTQGIVDAQKYTIWTTLDDLYFEDVTFGEAAKVLEERFKVKIVFTDADVRSKRFTSTFDKSASLDQALKSICEFNESFYSYDKEKATVTISSKSQTN
jgi:ferric-dicitrate binding protein FerR (iron transport regulator)